jgi:hypothetical protein
MKVATPLFDVGLVRDASEQAEALRLRYAVFVQELGGDGLWSIITQGSSGTPLIPRPGCWCCAISQGPSGLRWSGSIG